MAGRNLSADIYETLSKRINTWEYPPGRRLIEEEISAQFEVSRSPVREALNKLVEEGLVRKEERRGYEVRSVDLREINELYDTRLVLELAVLERICAVGMDESVRAGLEKRWRELLAALPELAEEAVLEDERFHETLAECGGNRIMMGLLKDIDRRIHFVRLSDITDPERLRTTCTDHLDILEAVGRGDGGLAAELLRRNIEWGREKVSAALKDALARAHGIF